MESNKGNKTMEKRRVDETDGGEKLYEPALFMSSEKDYELCLST